MKKLYREQWENKSQNASWPNWYSVNVFTVDMVDLITPHKMRGMRSLLNNSAMDILYYTSPLYRSEVCGFLQ